MAAEQAGGQVKQAYTAFWKAKVNEAVADERKKSAKEKEALEDKLRAKTLECERRRRHQLAVADLPAHLKRITQEFQVLKPALREKEKASKEAKAESARQKAKLDRLHKEWGWYKAKVTEKEWRRVERLCSKPPRRVFVEKD